MTVWFPNDTPEECMIYVKKLEGALEESLKLQSHYAELLNMRGGRIRKQWIDRLDETIGEPL